MYGYIKRKVDIKWIGRLGLTYVHYFFFISWRLITSQYCSGFCHTLTWISHGVTCAPHPDPTSHLPLYPIPLSLPSAPGLSTCLMHPTWAGDLLTRILEREMAPDCSILAWRIPWTEEPGRLQSIGSHRVRHDWSDLALTMRTYCIQHWELNSMLCGDLNGKEIQKKGGIHMSL